MSLIKNLFGKNKSPDRSEWNVQHDAEERRFVVRFDNDDEEAENRYYMSDEGEITFIHTYVPPAQQSQGVAGALAKAGLEYAKSKKYRVVPTCPVVKAYIDRHKEYEALLKN